MFWQGAACSAPSFNVAGCEYCCPAGTAPVTPRGCLAPFCACNGEGGLREGVVRMSHGTGTYCNLNCEHWHVDRLFKLKWAPQRRRSCVPPPPYFRIANTSLPPHESRSFLQNVACDDGQGTGSPAATPSCGQSARRTVQGRCPTGHPSLSPARGVRQEGPG
jgi:hypothetical protein